MTEPRKKRVVIIGAGPTAIGALFRLSELLGKNEIEPLEILVIEQSSTPGGLASTVTDPQGFSWDLGVHVTGVSRFPAFLEALQDAVPEWHCIERCVKADMAHVIRSPNPLDNYVPYPVQSSVPYFPDEIKQKCLNELMGRFESDPPRKEFENFHKFSEYFFGKTLQDLFIRPYNEKVWTVTLPEMNCKWVKGRVPKVDVQSILERCTLSLPELRDHDSKSGISFFRYPADCLGMGELWKRVTMTYPQSYFKYNTEVTKIDPDKKEVYFKAIKNKNSQEQSVSYDHLISTMPLTYLGKLTNLCPDLHLKHSKVVLVGVGLRQPQSAFAEDLSWAYFPRPEIIFYRCTVISNFSPLLVPDISKYWSVLCEIGVKDGEAVDTNKLIKKTIEGLMQVGIIEAEDQVYSVWTKTLEYGYPIPTINRESEIERANAVLEKHDIYSRGRFGGWRYEASNQDCSFEIGRQLVDKIFLNVPETLSSS